MNTTQLMRVFLPIMLSGGKLDFAQLVRTFGLDGRWAQVAEDLLVHQVPIQELVQRPSVQALLQDEQMLTQKVVDAHDSVAYLLSSFGTCPNCSHTATGAVFMDMRHPAYSSKEPKT